MNLLDLFVKIGVQDEASSKIESLTAGVIAKGTLIADAIKSAVTTAASGMWDLVNGALEAYGTFEQQAGGMETFFGDAANTVIENAKNAYSSAGMSANEYMSTVSSFAMSLITSVAKERESAAQGDTEAQKAALDQQVEDLEASLDSSYSARKSEYDREYDAQSEAFSNELAQLKDALQDQYDQRAQELDDEIDLLKEAQKERVAQAKAANEAEYTQYKRYYEDKYSALEDELSRETEALKDQQARNLSEIKKAHEQEYESRRQSLEDALNATKDAMDAEVDAFEKATDEKIKQIDRQYREQVKLYDQEEYERLKAIDDQIDALNGQTEAERKAHEEQEREKKLSELAKRVATAESQEEQTKALEAYNDYVAQIEQKQREESRNAQIAQLKEQKEAIKTAYDERKDQLREQVDEEKSTYKESRAEQLEALKKSNSDQLEAQRRANSDQLSQLKSDQGDYIAQIEAANKEELSALETKNGQILLEEKRANEDALKALQDAQQDEIAAIEAANARELKEAQRANKEELGEIQTANANKVKEVEKGQKDILKQLQAAHEEQLKELQKANKDQLAEFTAGIEAQKKAIGETGFVEPLYEDQQKAAELADIAVRDMSDNANKMGTDIGSVQNAYQGFAKGNMTMLDNLKLGYGGTKEEMERLLTDAENVKAKYGEVADYSSDSFADIVDAIHVLQTEMGISGLSVDELKEKLGDTSLFTNQELGKLQEAWGMQGASLDEVRAKAEELAKQKEPLNDFTAVLGTTAVEGADTYEGAISRVKAAWDNWLISLTDPEWDVTESTTTLMEEVANAAGIIIPRVVEILTTLATEVAARAPEIWETFKTELMNSLPEEWRTKIEEFITKIAGFFGAVETAIEWIEKFGPALTVAAEIVGGVTVFNSLKTTFEGLVGIIKILTGATGLGSVAGAAEGAAGGLAAVEGAAATAAGAGGFGALATAMAPFLLGGALIVGVGGGLLYLVGTNDELMKSIEGVITKTDDLKTDTEIQTASIGSDWEKMTKAQEATVEETSKNIEVTTAGMYTDIYSKMRDTRQTVETESEGASTSATNSFDTMRNGISASFDGAKGVMDNMVATWKGDLSDMDTDTNTKTSSIKTKFDNNVNKVKDSAQDAIKAASDKWKSGLSSMETETSTKSQKIETTADKCATSVEKSFTGVKLDTAGNNIMVGFYNGLVSAWNDKVVPFISDLAQWIVDNKGPEEYDKKLLVKNGKWIMQGLSDGLEDGFTGNVRPEVEGMADRLGDAMGTTQMQVDFEEVENAFKATTENVMQTWKTGLDRMADEVKFFAAKTREAMAESYSPFAKSVQSNMSLATGNNQSQGTPTVVNAVLQLDRVQFGRLVFQLNGEEEQRVGVELAGGFA